MIGRLAGWRWALAGLFALLLVPLLSQAVANTVDVYVSVSPTAIYATVDDIRLDLPADQLASLHSEGNLTVTRV